MSDIDVNIIRISRAIASVISLIHLEFFPNNKSASRASDDSLPMLYFRFGSRSGHFSFQRRRENQFSTRRVVSTLLNTRCINRVPPYSFCAVYLNDVDFSAALFASLLLNSG